MRRKVAVRAGVTGTGSLAGTRDSASPDTLESVADPVELFNDMMEVEG